MENPGSLLKGDFVHLMRNDRPIDSGAVDEIGDHRIAINSAVDYTRRIHLVFSYKHYAWFFEDDESDYFDYGFRINPNYPFYLKKDEKRIPIKPA